MQSLLRDGTEVQWSDTATVVLGDHVFSAFQMDSYVARVTFTDGYTVAVAGRPGARKGRSLAALDAWLDEVVQAAREAKTRGATVVTNL